MIQLKVFKLGCCSGYSGWADGITRDLKRWKRGGQRDVTMKAEVGEMPLLQGVSGLRVADHH